MQKEDISLETNADKKEPALSLYTEEEIEDVSTTSSWTKNDSVATGEVNFSEVSSTSEDTYQLPSTSNKSIFMDLYEEDIVDSGSENVTSMKNPSVSANPGDTKKPNPGLLLLGEYADSGNDTEEETLSSLRVKREKHNETDETSNNKNSNTECARSEAVHDENETSKKSVEPDINASCEVSTVVNKISSPVVEKTEDGKDADVHEQLDDSLVKFKRSVSKEEGQISAESDSSIDERSSESRKDSKKHKDVKKDKSRKKDKKKKKKKKKKEKHTGEKKEPDATEDEEKKELMPTRSRSRESSEKRKSFKPSRSRSRDRDSRRRHRSRSRSQDKAKWPRRRTERSKRSRSRSAGHRRSATNKNSDLKSRSRSPKRSVSPFNRRKERKDRRTPTSRRESPSSKRRKVSRSRSPRARSRSPRRSAECKRSRSPRRRSRSPEKRRRVSPGKSSSRKEKSPNRRERKGTPSPPRKSSYRTSSASDSLDSGHFTNIPLSKTNKPDELVLDNKDSVEKSPPNSEKPTAEKQEPNVFPKPGDLEKQYSPSSSPAKPWEDEFDFVFTERMSPRQGTEKSVEDVIFGSEAKTPDFKRPATGESKKSKPKESKQKEESKAVKLTGITALADKENNLAKKIENQNESSTPAIKADENRMSSLNNSKSDILASKTTKSDVLASKTTKSDVLASKTTKSDVEVKTDDGKKTENNSESVQTSNSADESAFVQSKMETIPFLDEASSAPPPVSGIERRKAPPTSQVGILGPPPAALLPTPSLLGRTWMGLGEVGLLPTPGSLQNVNFNKNEIVKAKTNTVAPSLTRKDEQGSYNFDASPMDMEMSSPEGDIIDQMNEEFWKQQQQPGRARKTENEGSKSRDVLAEFMVNEQSLVEEPYEPGSGPVIGEESEEDLNSITDPKERRKREKQHQREKTKVQELIDKLHRQARVEEEVKHALKAYYKHRDINKEEYKSILRRAVPQVTNSSSAIDPERIRSLVKKYVAKMKGQRVNSD